MSAENKFFPAAPSNSSVLVFGSGLVCAPLIRYLSEYEIQIVLASRTLSKATAIVDDLPASYRCYVKCVECDVEANNESTNALLKKLVSESYIVLSLLPYIHHATIAQICLDENKHFFTTSYISPALAAFDQEARRRGLVWLQECGVDPGLDHMSAQKMIDEFHSQGGRVTSFYSICGGLPAPAANNNPLQYKLSWSPRGVLLASTNTATYFHRGEKKTVSGPSLYELNEGYVTETIDVPESLVSTVGVNKLYLERYPNRDSTPYVDNYNIKDCHTLMRGTYRNKGWCYMMKYFSSFKFTSIDTNLANETWRNHALNFSQSNGPTNISFAQFTHCVLTNSNKLIDSSVDVKKLSAELIGLNNLDADILVRWEFLDLFRHDKFLPKPDYVKSRLLSSLDVLCHLFEEKLNFAEKEADMIVMKHTFDVEFSNSHREQWSCVLLDIGQQAKGGYSSMARTVSLPVAIAMRALLQGRWPSDILGVIRPVQKPIYTLILQEMETLGVHFIEKREPTEFWLRSEVKPGERRTAIAPADASALIKKGFRVTVEKSNHRCFPDSDYESIGCRMVETNTWETLASPSAIVIGLKELPEEDGPLYHRHLFFAHCYKNQAGWQELLSRFIQSGTYTKNGTNIGGNGVSRAGGVRRGLLYDLEFLVDSNNRRIAAFGKDAGYAGMGLGLLQWANKQLNKSFTTPLQPWDSLQAMIDNVKKELDLVGRRPSVLVLGALGRCGGAAVYICEQVGITPIKWDIAETSKGGPFKELLDVDVLCNSIYLSPAVSTPPFITKSLLEEVNASGNRRLTVLVDVSCDTSNPNHPFPFYNQGTTLFNPVLPISLPNANSNTNNNNTNGLDVIAIDHLPSLIPSTASIDFSAALTPHLLAFEDHNLNESRHPSAYIFNNAEKLYNEKIAILPIPQSELSRRTNFWSNYLRGVSDLLLPSDYPRSKDAIHQVIEQDVHHELPKSTVHNLIKIGLALESNSQFSLSGSSYEDGQVTESSRVTPFTLLLSSFAILLHRWSGEESFTVGSSSTSHNPFVLKIQMNGNSSFQQVVSMVHTSDRDAADNELPYNKIVQSVAKNNPNTSTGTGTGPLFRVRFFNQTDMPEATALLETATNADLTVFVTSRHSSSLREALIPSLRLRVIYNQLLFAPRRIEAWLDQLNAVITFVAEKGLQQTIGSIPLSTNLQSQWVPNPRTNLHWSQFVGSIPEIFCKNAALFPNRTFVVEHIAESYSDASYPSNSASPSTLKNRSFTYQQLHYASNLVAHFLIGRGIGREEVVTLFSYRGVDLVVAIMGVLKAGAIFSVIDPAYPPSRQNIYLQVAQPKCLIVLAKAGLLPSSVREYISTNLKLKAEIPALEINDDGHLEGGTLDGEHDVLDEFRSLASQNVDVVIGPDSIGTLSFTSGSTGIPKGCRGRHFSLTHYYPWMAGEFGISEKDRFTMCSGIAHDPIQRDIFTPLFFGAELHIPTSDDIGTPGRLAEWMSASQITITHLTPAMAQLLSSHAQTSIPSLHHAFLVGDILTKRDAMRLQKIAPNLHIVNMYGTTETQRAVSYYTLPPANIAPAFMASQKDVIPAGKGMINVQLVVVNRFDRTLMAGIGESGEVYVRAAGLAEGYLGLEEDTALKFVPNWFTPNPFEAPSPALSGEKWFPFWKGKRDRLYRTGDLGRYLPNGLVEVSGRADDQVKVRGFRIELGEIDVHLSQHPLIRENTTLVRRDKNEEPTLVTYFVPNIANTELIQNFESSGSEDDELLEESKKDQNMSKPIFSKKRYRRLIQNIREYLKTKLPTYSIPSVFVPLRKMPINPNGKIDKPALPFPDSYYVNESDSNSVPAQSNKVSQSESTSNSASSLTPTERAVLDIWKSLLSHSNISVEDNFFDVGGHSVLATRLIFELRRSLSVDVPLGLVFSGSTSTIKGMAAFIDKITSNNVLQVGVAVEIKQDKPSNSNEKSTNNNTNNSIVDDDVDKVFDYAADFETLLASLPSKFEPLANNNAQNESNYFLTGATGFLGMFVLHNILTYVPNSRVYCLVRGNGIERLKSIGVEYGVWQDEWAQGNQPRIIPIAGDLAKPKYGLDDTLWNELAATVDVVIHNGAMVHWLFPYTLLRAANVLSTLTAVELSSTKKTKKLCFVSSTSVLDTTYYQQLSDEIVSHSSVYDNASGISENDNLSGSRTGLMSGYAQSKWVSENLLFAARARGLPCSIVRPGYILGHSVTGVCNTNDFIWRLVKGCAQLSVMPSIQNILNATPVDYVANCVVTVARYSDLKIANSSNTSNVAVYHVYHPYQLRFNDLLSLLPEFNYDVKTFSYIEWRDRLMAFTLTKNDNALYPLLHHVTDDLPSSTKAPALDDKQMNALLAFAFNQQVQTNKDHHCHWPKELVKCPCLDHNRLALYYNYLKQIKFLP